MNVKPWYYLTYKVTTIQYPYSVRDVHKQYSTKHPNTKQMFMYT